MSLTTIVGALLAVVARPKQERIKEEREIEHLRRSHARLVDHIERLEREIALTQKLLAHWRNEAARLARQNRDRRERAMFAGTQSCEHALYNAASAQQAQQNIAYAQQAQGAQLAGLAQQNALGQESVVWCNCAPSRAQVWGQQHGLVQQLNDNTVKE